MQKLFILLVFACGCSYTPALDDLTCAEEGATRPGQRCEGGVWVVVAPTGDAGPADMDSGGGEDVTPPIDMAEPRDTMMSVDMSADMPVDMPCSAESDALFCARLALNCGPVTNDDNCGAPRTADCGMCVDTIEACVANLCAPVPETDQELCDAAGATCDEITVPDRTGAMRTVNCGMCIAPLGCGDGGTPNTCACANADDVQFCLDNGANCGPVTAMDPTCLVVRTVNCGVCTLPETCAGGGAANVCGCIETDAAFCSRLALNCGSVTADDACGFSRTVNCGACALPETCGGGAVPNVCGCTVANACTAASAQCGVVNAAASCANLATADCGGCGTEGVCATNTCMCNSGYGYNGTTCVDLDECALGTDLCDVAATCANTAGSYTCTCIPPAVGDGFTCAVPPNPPTVEQIVTDTTTNSTLTTGQMTGVDDDLYVAFVSIRTVSRTVQSIAGLGLTWTRAGEHCDGTDNQVVEVWTARGNTTGSSDIVVSLSGSPSAAVTIVYRITNVPNAGSAGTAFLQNSNGPSGVCNSSNPQATYNFAYAPLQANSLILAGTAIESSAHVATGSWTEDNEQHRGGGGGNDAGLATMSYTNSSTAAIAVEGTITPQQNWATAVFEVRGL